MVFRQSLRLLGMGPEMQPFQDKCFICQSDLDIHYIIRCQVMPCYGKFLHKRCFRKACHVVAKDQDNNSTESINDQLRANESLNDLDENAVSATPLKLRGPTLIERARNAITDLRSSATAHSLHQPGTCLWNYLPYPIDPMVWYFFWVNLDWFIFTTPEEVRPLYIHAVVYKLIDPVQSVRKAVYRQYRLLT